MLCHSVDSGRAVSYPLKHSGEVGYRGKSDRLGNFKNALVRARKQFFRLAHAHEVEIFGKGRSRCRSENTAKIAFIKAENRAYVIEGNVFGVIFVNVL